MVEIIQRYYENGILESALSLKNNFINHLNPGTH